MTNFSDSKVLTILGECSGSVKVTVPLRALIDGAPARLKHPRQPHAIAHRRASNILN